MNLTEAIDYINAHTWSQWRLGLSRTRDLLERLGDPQKKLRFIHVAGSNGKGSTCAMLERILREAGFVTGLFPSPYIEDFRERIQVCGDYITGEALCRITDRVRRIADTMEDHPTQFELITAIGMVYFLEKKCDIVVLEVGLGGTYDATNVIDAPEAAVIMKIGLEHTEYLGNTLAEIASNKCGIIKPGTRVVCCENEPEVMEVVRRTCADRGCPLHVARFDRIIPLEKSLDGQTFLWKTEKFTLALAGEYQLHNAAAVLTVVDLLRTRGFTIPAEAVRRGLSRVQWPARFEVLSRRPVFILDGGHNPQCAEALALSLREYFPGRKMVFLMGMLADKDYRAVIDIITPLAAAFVCLTPASPRALPARDLARELGERGWPALPCDTPEEGIRAALDLAEKLRKKAAAEKKTDTCGGQPVSGSNAEGNREEEKLRDLMPGGPEPDDFPVIAFGSLYMAGDIRRAFSGALIASQKTAEKEAEAAQAVPSGKNRSRKAGRPKDDRKTGSGIKAPEKGTAKTDRIGNTENVENSDNTDRNAESCPEESGEEISRRKKQQRREALSRRRGLTKEERAAKSASICRLLEDLPELRRAQTVFSYAAVSDEADLDAVNRSLEACGKRVCYPVVGEDGTMEAFAPDPGDPAAWRIGAFGIREPETARAVPVPPVDIDAVLVPCTAFDRHGGRCGHGGGYYDRFLAGLPKEVPKILAAFDVQETDCVAVDENDVRMDLAVTESGVFRP